MPCRDWFCKIDKAECLGPAIHLTIDGVLDEFAGEGRLTRATLRSVPGLFAFARGAGRFNERRCCGFAFILVDQCLKLRRECRVGRTYRQPLEEESPFRKNLSVVMSDLLNGLLARIIVADQADGP
jgi:hypothetical protein